MSSWRWLLDVLCWQTMGEKRKGVRNAEVGSSSHQNQSVIQRFRETEYVGSDDIRTGPREMAEVDPDDKCHQT
jgi:hypothetical protein